MLHKSLIYMRAVITFRKPQEIKPQSGKNVFEHPPVLSVALPRVSQNPINGSKKKKRMSQV